MQLTPNQYEIRRLLLEIDAFVRNNGTAFRAAFEKLVGQLCPSNQAACLKILDRYERGICEFDGMLSPIEIMPIVCAAPVLITYFHMATGAPLHLGDELLTAWGRGGGSAFQCMRCGYRFPAGFSLACVLCGGRLAAAGAWELNRAAVLGN